MPMVLSQVFVIPSFGASAVKDASDAYAAWDDLAVPSFGASAVKGMLLRRSLSPALQSPHSGRAL